MKDLLMEFSDAGDGVMILNGRSSSREDGGKYMEAVVGVDFYRSGSENPLFVSATERCMYHAIDNALKCDIPTKPSRAKRQSVIYERKPKSCGCR